MTRGDVERELIAIPCPQCGAPSGEWCYPSPTGIGRAPHQYRIDRVNALIQALSINRSALGETTSE